MTLGKPDTSCRAGGFLADVYVFSPERTEFVSEPLHADVVVGGPATLRLTLVNEAEPVTSIPFLARMVVLLDAVSDDGTFVVGVSGSVVDTKTGPKPGVGEYELAIPPVTVPAGSRLRLQLRISGFVDRTRDTMLRLLWGGEYAATGLDLTTVDVSPL
jgi:hypothetical protein